jgi:hypothetical protein
MVDKAGLYGGGLELTCILYEGTITATAGTSVFVENGSLGKLSFTMAAEIKEGDIVAIHDSTDNDYDACGGLPVMTAAAATAGWIGIVKSQPVWHKLPTAAGSHGTHATNLSNGWYRVATVVMPGVSMALRGVTEDTSITSGEPVAWDVSGDGWKGDNTTFSGTFSFHDGGGTGQNILIGIGVAGAQAGGSEGDQCGYRVVA